MATGVIIAVIALGGLGFLASIGLSLASRFFGVKVDPRVTRVREVLPGANCGACGFAGCDAFAKAVVEGKADVAGCVVGGPSVAEKIGEILGKKAEAKERMVARVRCQGTVDKSPYRFDYYGVESCKSSLVISEGRKACTYGCEGFGDCVAACMFDAIHMGEGGVPVVDEDKCTACGKCVAACPKNIIILEPVSSRVTVRCSSHDIGKVVRGLCTIGCIACGLCAKRCPSQAITLVDNLPVWDYEKCINCGICAYVCPTKAIKDDRKEIPKAFISDACTGCGECVKVCPVKNCISGEQGKPHKINEETCIGCGLCVDVCPVKAIELKKPVSVEA